MNKKCYILTSIIAVFFVSTICFGDTIKIGFNIPLTGEIPKVGEESKYAAEMLKNEINAKGGLDVGGTKYTLEFIYEDNESKAESAVTAALKLIERDQVLAIVGPNSNRTSTAGSASSTSPCAAAT